MFLKPSGLVDLSAAERAASGTSRSGLKGGRRERVDAIVQLLAKNPQPHEVLLPRTHFLAFFLTYYSAVSSRAIVAYHATSISLLC